jgi:hypothetical protein
MQSAFGVDYLLNEIKKLGIDFKTTSQSEAGGIATQVHGYVLLDDRELLVSFIEDSFADTFDKVIVNGVATESIEGLYHRKLRTLTGTAISTSPTGSVVGNGRQKARDLFDLYVLDQEVSPICTFIDSINKQGANFPESVFDRAIRSINWMDLTDEFKAIKSTRSISSKEVKALFDRVINELRDNEQGPR